MLGLLVDDDEVLLEQMSKYLMKRGHEVDTSLSGSKAIEMMKAKEYDFMITDLKMPRVDGMEVLKNAKKILPNMFIIMLTGYGTVETAVEAMKSGAYDYLSKPFKMQDMQKKIDEIEKELKLGQDLRRIKLMQTFKSSSYLNFLGDYNIDKPLLLITKENPDEIKEKLQFDQIELVWLSGEESPYSIPPKKLVLIKDKIRGFSREFKSGIVFIHGLETLIEAHGWSNVKRFLYFISEDVISEDMQFILTVKPEILDSVTIRDVASHIARDFVKAIGDSLSNKARIGIIKELAVKNETSFTSLKKELKVINSSALAFHLKKLLKDGFVYIDDNKKYKLSQKGQRFADLIMNIEEIGLTDIGGRFLLLIDEQSD
jgi:ActR/RegA family two-component response regulator/DNA-binding HxlR family transcriptional regulator